MKIAFDIDGTLTYFSQFIQKNSNYILKKYNIPLTNKNGYDVDEMFELEKHFHKLNLSHEEVKKKIDLVLNSFWNRYYLKYLFSDFRSGVVPTLNKLIADGHEIVIISSRKKTCDNDPIGKFVKYSTILKFKINRINNINIKFFRNDYAKIRYILENNFDLAVDDKFDVINELSKKIDCICINTPYNNYKYANNVSIVNSYDNNEVYNIISKKYNKNNTHINNLKIFHSIQYNNHFYKLIKAIGTPFVSSIYKPIILNQENISTNKPLIYAPNHRKTLDPFFIVLSSSDVIHWAALKRFFTREDSIFNNSKNPFLCSLTSFIFRGIGAVPVERGGNTSNMIDTINYYLQNKCNIGIFPEGTTNKNPEKQELLEIKSGIIHFAKDNDALIQPVSIIWVPEELEIKHKVLVNYCPPFSMANLSIDEGIEIWKLYILKGIEENKKVINELINAKIKIKK